MKSHLDRNLRALLTRALPDDAPSEALVIRVLGAVRTALAERVAAGPPRRSTGAPAVPARRALAGARATRVAAVAAALLLVVLGFSLRDLWGPRDAGPEGGGAEAWLARGVAALREGPAGPWRALRDGEAVAAATFEVRTPPSAGVAFDCAPGAAEAAAALAVRLGPGAALVREAATGVPVVRLAAGTVELHGPPRVLRGAAAEVRGDGRLRAALEAPPGEDALALGLESTGAALRVTGSRALTDATGRALAPGTTWFLQGSRTVALTAPGRGDTREVAGGAETAATGASATPPSPDAPPAPPALSGRVTRDADDTPVRAFRLWIKREVTVPEVAEPVLHEVEDAEGRFSVPLIGGGSYTLVVEAPDLAPVRLGGLVATTPDAAHVPGTVALVEGASLTGAVGDAATGAPVAGALVVVETSLARDVIDVHGRDLTPLPFGAAHTDANGGYRLEHVSPGPVVLRVSRPGYAPEWSGIVDVPREPGTVREVAAIALGEGGVATGRVERANGAPWPGSQVVLSMMRGGVDPAAMTYGEAVTDADGTYRIEDLPPGYFVALSFGSPSEPLPWPLLQQASVTRGEVTRIDFLGDRGGVTVSGTLRDARGIPLADLDLTIFRLDDAPVQEAWLATRSSADGGFEFEGVAAGRWALTWAENGFEDQQVLHAFVVGADGDVVLEVELPAGALTIVAVDVDGAPVAGGRIVVERDYSDTGGGWGFAANRSLGLDGRSVLGGLAPGRYRALVFGDELGVGHLALGPLELALAESRVERCTVPPGGALEVVVTRADSRITDLFVTLEDAAGRELQPTLDPRVDASGRRLVSGLAPGRYRVTVEAVDGFRLVRELDVLAGQIARVSVER